jgi:hypothetical protein|tara:strand:+ start:140 stop:2506 length:2367 start_codon:yes stop_codon:yes gene_type:complete
MTNQIRNQKDQLAKLMATEDLTIVHKKVPTAYFDMKNRILCCPILKDDISNELYDLFMGHEVGHALHTPYEGVHSALTENRTLKGYLNVVEDVRIERKIREKYQGLRKSFYTAYNELMEIDFFGISKRNLQELSLIDKINLITKVGSRVAIKLTKVEQEFLDWSMRCETWDEVVECATAIYEYSKENETRTEDDEKLVPQTLDLGDEEDSDDGEDYGDEEDEDGEDDGDSQWEDSDEDNLPDLEENEGSTDGQGEEQDIEEESENQVKNTGKDGGEGESSDYDDEKGARESITEHAAHNNEEQFISEDNAIVTLIDLKSKFDKNKNYSEMVIGYKQVIQDWDTELWNKECEGSWETERLAKMVKRGKITAKKLTDKNSKLVQHMAKEFEMKQTAMQASKATTGKTGKLDMNKLAKYKIVDDVFKKVTMIPDGQNHGVNVLLDWSGSINNQCCDLLEQTIILVQFCRKVGIPHRVYLFSDTYISEGDYWSRGESSSLIEIFSNEMSSRDYTTNLINVSSLWNNFFSNRSSYRHFEKFLVKWNTWFDGIDVVDGEESRWINLESCAAPQKYRLGGTPLDNSLLAMRTELVKFNKKYNVEKSILTVITDGFSHQSDAFEKSSEETLDQDDQEKNIDSGDYGWRRTRQTRKFQDPFSKKLYTYSDQTGYSSNGFVQTQNLLDWISKETGVIVTGYFVFETKREIYSISGTVDLGDVDATWRQMRKEGVAIKCHGYNKLFLTSASTLATDGDDELDEKFVGAKKASILAAFKRNQRTKSTSRFLTNEFIKEIA